MQDKRFLFGPPRDLEGSVELFALVLSNVQLGFPGRRFDVSPGTLLQWIHSGAPSIADLEAGIHSAPRSSPPSRWPERLTSVDRWYRLQGGPFLSALRFALDAAPRFQVTSGSDICRVL